MSEIVSIDEKIKKNKILISITWKQKERDNSKKAVEIVTNNKR